MTDGERIVQIARTYVGTKHHHQGRLKGVGIDCIGLVAGVCGELNIPYTDMTNYSRQPDGHTIIGEFDRQLDRIDLAELSAGDVLVFWITCATRPQHCGFYTEKGGLIHTYEIVKKVVEHRLDDRWRRRIVAAYRLPL